MPRMRILSPSEQEAFDKPPLFDHRERKKFFESSLVPGLRCRTSTALAMYKMASRTSRIAVLRGRPVVLGGGRNGAIKPHS